MDGWKGSSCPKYLDRHKPQIHHTMTKEKLTFLGLAKKVLEETGQAMSASEIWEYAKRKGYDALVDTRGATPANTLNSVLYLDSKKPNSAFTLHSHRPKRYVLRGSVSAPLYVPGYSVSSSKIREEDLYDLVCLFVKSHDYFQAYPKKINHSASLKKKQGGLDKWVHPDIVACHFVEQDYAKGLIDLMKHNGESRIKIYSFEIKVELSFSNLKEAFFQAVSNSSWAHEGYLVAWKIETDPDFRRELERLSNSFGIGVIELDLSKIGSTDICNEEEIFLEIVQESFKILFPARSKDQLDWEALDELSYNGDIQKFIGGIVSLLKSEDAMSNFLSGKLTHKEWFDLMGCKKVMDELLKKLKEESKEQSERAERREEVTGG